MDCSIVQFEKIGSGGQSGSETEATMAAEGGARKKNPADIVWADRRCSQTAKQLVDSGRWINLALCLYKQEQYSRVPTNFYLVHVPSLVW